MYEVVKSNWTQKKSKIHKREKKKMGTCKSFILPVLLGFLLIIAVDSRAIPDWCESSCGAINISYPFGIGKPVCAHNDSFFVDCRHSTAHNLPRPFYNNTEIISFDLSRGKVTVLHNISRGCYNTTMKRRYDDIFPLDLTKTPFTFSTSNQFTVTGCATVGYLGNESNFTAACVSLCLNLTYLPDDVCSGIGCCKISITEGMKFFNVSFNTIYGKLRNKYQNNCSYAFLVQGNKFQFNKSILEDNDFTTKQPVVLDFSVEKCGIGRSHSINSSSGLGYLCKCDSGYDGNPYLDNGCKDVDECAQVPHKCQGICVNTPGSFYCLCPEGMDGNASTSYGCIPIPNSKSKLIIGLAVGLGGGLFVLLSTGGSLWIYKASKKLKKKKLKERYTKQNYELLLKQPISSEDVVKTKMFSLKELEKATNNFDSRRIIGTGGHGTVYKGLLLDQRVVAIKKSKKTDQKEIEEYINEVALLSRIHHKNVVELIGCSLESDVPLLVYEFIGNGTLSRHLYIWNRDSYLSWDDRLRIATEVAGAIAYLHSACSRTIFHRDLKSANILLDEKLTAKVADFGASKTLISEEAYITTAVQGTVGYLDPEYYGTGQLTEKSDVYSIGVILVELLTGQKIVSEARPQEQQNLAPYFIRLLKQDQIFEIIEGPILKEAEKEELESVAWLAESCLRLKGEERPTMKKVEETLGGLRMSRKKQKPRTDHEDFESFLSYDIPEVGSSQSTNTQQNLQAPFLPAQSFIR